MVLLLVLLLSLGRWFRKCAQQPVYLMTSLTGDVEVRPRVEIMWLWCTNSLIARRLLVFELLC